MECKYIYRGARHKLLRGRKCEIKIEMMESHEGGDNSNGEGGKRKKNETLFSEITKDTVSKIKRHCYRSRGGNEPKLCTIHDNTSPGYQWLLPGWVAEERHMMSGRVYRVRIVYSFFIYLF